MMHKNKKVLRWIGSLGEVIGYVTIQVPFVKWGIIYIVDFSIMKEYCPSQLSSRDMITKGLEHKPTRILYALRPTVTTLILGNYFFQHKWSAPDTPYLFYTEQELRKIHRGFGQPSVKSTDHLFRRAPWEIGRII